jgi:hypothetical protein
MRKREEIMTTTFSSKSILAVSVLFIMTIMSSTADAWVKSTTSLQQACQLPCSIEVDGALKGLGNVTNDPTAFAVSILIQEGTLVFTNPAGNSRQAQGVPFVNVSVSLEGLDLINPAQVSKNGSTLSTIIFHDPALIQVINDAIVAACDGGDPIACEEEAQIQNQISQHPNWLQRVVVTKMQVLGQQFVSGTPSGCTITSTTVNGETTVTIDPSCTPTDALGSACDAPNAVTANPQKYVTQGFSYACTPVCHDKTGSGLPICPASLPLP